MTLRGGGLRSAPTYPDDITPAQGTDRPPPASVAAEAGPPGQLEHRVERWNPALAIVGLAVGGYLLICLLFTGVGLLVSHFGPLTRWDDSVNRWFAANRTGSTSDWTSNATKVANTSGILVVLAVAAIVLFVLRHRWDALVLLVALGLELSTFLTVNYLVDRPRPDVEHLGSVPSTSSFPSGHTAAMVALYGGLAMIVGARVRSRLVGVACWIVAVLAAAAIGFARVYRGMHHPSDVMAGALLGLAALAVAALAVRTGQMATADRRTKHGRGDSFDHEVAA